MLTPPVPVNVLKGRIKGKKQEPYEEYVKKPGRIYQEDLPPTSTDKDKPASDVSQRQTL